MAAKKKAPVTKTKAAPAPKKKEPEVTKKEAPVAKTKAKAAHPSQAEFDALAAKVRRMSDNWHKFAAKFIGRTDNGEVEEKAGHVRLALLLSVFVLAAGVYCVQALDYVGYGNPDNTDDTWSDTAGGTLVVSNLTAGGTITGGTISGPISGAVSATTLTASGATVLDSTAYVSGVLTVSNSVYMGHSSVWKTFTFDGSSIDTISALTPTNNQVLAGLGNVSTVSPAGPMTNTVAVPTAAGRTYTIINIAAQPYFLIDAATLELAGNWEGNQYDSITLRSIDTSSWVEVSRSDN